MRAVQFKYRPLLLCFHLLHLKIKNDYYAAPIYCTTVSVEYLYRALFCHRPTHFPICWLTSLGSKITSPCLLKYSITGFEVKSNS